MAVARFPEMFSKLFPVNLSTVVGIPITVYDSQQGVSYSSSFGSWIEWIQWRKSRSKNFTNFNKTPVFKLLKGPQDQNICFQNHFSPTCQKLLAAYQPLCMILNKEFHIRDHLKAVFEFDSGVALFDSLCVAPVWCFDELLISASNRQRKILKWSFWGGLKSVEHFSLCPVGANHVIGNQIAGQNGEGANFTWKHLRGALRSWGHLIFNSYKHLFWYFHVELLDYMKQCLHWQTIPFFTFWNSDSGWEQSNGRWAVESQLERGRVATATDTLPLAICQSWEWGRVSRKAAQRWNTVKAEKGMLNFMI